MLVQKKVVAGQTQHNAQGQYFRLISANSDLKITFIEDDYSEWSTVVKVGMQVPLEKLHRNIYIESPEEQILEFWWGKTPVDSMNATVIGASGVRVTKKICPAGETLLTLPSSLRKTIKIKSDQDIFVGNSGAGENGWPVKANVIEELPLAGSLYAYKSAPYFDEALAAHESKEFSIPSTSINLAHETTFAGSRLLNARTSDLYELNKDTGDMDLIYEAQHSGSSSYSRSRVWQSNYHQAVFILYISKFHGVAQVVKCNYNEVGHYEVVFNAALASLTDEDYNYRVLIRQNGKMWIYKSNHFYEIDLSTGTYQKHILVENSLLDKSANTSAFNLSEIDGEIVGFIRGDDNKYRYCKLNEQTLEFEDLDIVSTTVSPDYDAQYVGLGVLVFAPNTGNYIRFYDKDGYKRVDNSPNDIHNLTVVGKFVFVSTGLGSLYLVDMSQDAPDFILVGESPIASGSVQAFGIGYDYEIDKLYTLSPNADDQNSVVSVNTYASPLAGSLTGATVNVMEFLA